MGDQRGIALVTGGSRGIGGAFVLEAVRRGYRVVFSFKSRQEAADRTVAEAKRLMLRFSARLGEARFAESYDECFRSSIVPRLRSELREELEARRADGAVVLITANLRDFAVRLGGHLGIPASHCFGAVGARRDGALTGELAEPVPMSEVRARLVRGLLERACVQRERTCAYGDSIHDAPMLREVGRPCAVYPSRALRLLAQASGWRILG